jgi:hypothetical protein
VSASPFTSSLQQTATAAANGSSSQQHNRAAHIHKIQTQTWRCSIPCPQNHQPASSQGPCCTPLVPHLADCVEPTHPHPQQRHIIKGNCPPEKVLLRTSASAHRLCARLSLRRKGLREPELLLKNAACRWAHQRACTEASSCSLCQQQQLLEQASIRQAQGWQC